MKALFTSILTKKDGEWKHTLSVKENEYKDLMDELPEGTKLNITIEVQGKDATYSQKKRILLLREKKGYTLKKLAHKYDCSVSHIHKTIKQFKKK